MGEWGQRSRKEQLGLDPVNAAPLGKMAIKRELLRRFHQIIAKEHSPNGVSETLQKLSRIQGPVNYLPGEIDNHSVKLDLK